MKKTLLTNPADLEALIADVNSGPFNTQLVPEHRIREQLAPAEYPCVAITDWEDNPDEGMQFIGGLVYLKDFKPRP